jgi:hypothetical protein
MGVNYVIACWMGSRNYDDRLHAKDRSLFLRRHLEQLKILEHNLDQVTIVLAEGGDNDADAWAKSIEEVGGTPVRVIVRRNIGLSYGSWNEAYETFADDFDYSILAEDDYAPALDNFDRELVRLADRDNTYVCAMASPCGKLAAVSNGIIPHRVWKEVHPVPYDETHSRTRGNRSQRLWSGYFQPKGYPVTDWMKEFSTPFRQNSHAVYWYGHASLPPVFVPIQALGYKTRILWRESSMLGAIDNRGGLVFDHAPSEALWEEARSLPLSEGWVGRFR